MKCRRVRRPHEITSNRETVHDRKYQRAKWHDYAGGIYFITFCTKGMIQYFGHVDRQVMYHSPIGRYLCEQIEQLSQHYAYCRVLRYVVMPNHVHLLVYIDSEKVSEKKRTQQIFQSIDSSQNTSTFHRQIALTQSWVSVVLGGLKSAVTRYAHQAGLSIQWQRSFHDHIVRNHDEYDKIAQYIDTNPQRWERDIYNRQQR